MATTSHEVTKLLADWSNGDQLALDQLMPLVYGELRQMAHRYMARQNPGHTLQTTALINEAFIRMVGQPDKHFQNRSHFFGVAAQAMRSILVDYARSKQYDKRGGGAPKVSLDEALTVSEERASELVALDDALKELAKFDARKAKSETLTSPSDTTRPGLVMGTLGYMSPEQVRGKTVEAPSDIFSLGCVLYEMVGGKRPFAGETGAEVIAAILKEDPPRLTESVKDVPPDLERIISHCLEKNPDQRFQSARELTSDLRTMLSGSGQLTSPPMPKRWRFSPAAPAAWIGLTAAILLLGLTAWLYWRSTQVQAFDSLAILPLVNASGDANLEYLSDGITDSLINNLSQLPQLRVMARGTVFSYKGKEVDPRKVGQELKVRAVFTGRMVQRGDTLNIQADLVNASDGSQIWGDRYTRKLTDAQSILEEIAKKISEKMRLKLNGAEEQRLTKRQTENPEAYQLYLKGHYHSKQFSTDGLKKGIEYLNQAVELDPTYALAHAGLSSSYYDASNFIFPPEMKQCPK